MIPMLSNKLTTQHVIKVQVYCCKTVKRMLKMIKINKDNLKYHNDSYKTNVEVKQFYLNNQWRTTTIYIINK